MIKIYNVSEAKTQLSSLVEEVQRGVEVTVAKNGKPVARVTRIGPAPIRPVSAGDLRPPRDWPGSPRGSGRPA